MLAFVAGWCMHAFFVTMTWALEATARNPEKPHLEPLLVRALAKLPGGKVVAAQGSGGLLSRPIAGQVLSASVTSQDAAALPAWTELPRWHERLLMSQSRGPTASEEVVAERAWFAWSGSNSGPVRRWMNSHHREFVTPFSAVLDCPSWRLAPWDWAAIAGIVTSFVLGTLLAFGDAWSVRRYFGRFRWAAC